ncbi:sensor histidine kinase [Fibrella forsythiae]|uniref:Histidine kinase n=1 Tax=Fibrella forsythiae TaxID=2817061 RepID=A0ABS3JR79_9BACT|nr:histidine kinase [Fibrella forsythiae]MBO0952519.1 histidine kinase [Fibrella forsythiae]
MSRLLPFKLPRPLFNRPEAWFHLLWLPVVYPVAGGLLFGERYFRQFDVFIVGTLTMLGIHAVDLLLLTVLVRGIIAYYTDAQHIQRRNLMALGVGTLLASLMSVGTVWICSRVPILGTPFSASLALYLAGVGGISALLMGYVLIVTDTYGRWQAIQTEKEELLQLAMQQQLDALKGQINPHFLFNSLNSISSLIAQEPQKAEAFVDELAKVYRYMLQAHTRIWVPLGQEIQFARSYAQLLMVRYGPALLIQFDVAENQELLGVPPLTFRNLLDDILYHQVAQATKPLQVKIETGGQNQLLIRYNRQPRRLRVQAPSAGFDQVVNVYYLMGICPPQRETGQHDERIWLPLIPLPATTSSTSIT